jgi:hypothetical protein
MTRKPNPGWFQRGFDPRRHVLSRAERQKGYFWAMNGKMPSRTRAWLRNKIRGYYQRKAAQRRAST